MQRNKNMVDNSTCNTDIFVILFDYYFDKSSTAGISRHFQRSFLGAAPLLGPLRLTVHVPCMIRRVFLPLARRHSDLNSVSEAR